MRANDYKDKKQKMSYFSFFTSWMKSLHLVAVILSEMFPHVLSFFCVFCLLLFKNDSNVIKIYQSCTFWGVFGTVIFIF